MKRHTLTVEEVAHYLGIGPDTVYTMVKLKQLPHLETGDQIWFTEESIDLWMEDQAKMSFPIEN